jgi:hypothetical protein
LNGKNKVQLIQVCKNILVEEWLNQIISGVDSKHEISAAADVRVSHNGRTTRW